MFGPAVSAVITARVMVGRAGIAIMALAGARRITAATPERAGIRVEDVLSCDTSNAN
jgi:hypothetical protein